MLGLLLAITVINFVDRQSLSIVAPILRETLHLSNTDYGIIVGAFQMGMMVGEFPMGWLMDRRGVRFGLSFAVLWWSCANAVHAFGRTMAQFSLLRFWLGTGECGNYSGGLKVVSQWFPVRERALAVGIFNGGSMLGSILAPPLLVAVTLALGWRWAFALPSAMGFVWVAAWLVWYRSPAAVAGADAVEAPSNGSLLGLKRTWALMLCRFLVGPVVQFYIYWLPEYLYRERGLTLKAIGAFAWVPFLFGDIGSIVGGLAAAVLLRRGLGLRRTRQVTMGLGAFLCLFSIAVARATTAGGALAWICVVLLGHTFLSANMFATISDLFDSSAVGRVTALTGIAGGLSGMLFPWLTGALVDRFSYTPVFFLAAVMPLLGSVVLFGMTGAWGAVNIRRSQESRGTRRIMLRLTVKTRSSVGTLQVGPASMSIWYSGAVGQVGFQDEEAGAGQGPVADRCAVGARRLSLTGWPSLAWPRMRRRCGPGWMRCQSRRGVRADPAVLVAEHAFEFVPAAEQTALMTGQTRSRCTSSRSPGYSSAFSCGGQQVVDAAFIGRRIAAGGAGERYRRRRG